MRRPSQNALPALTSAVRQELASALGHGSATVTALAAQLGRTRQSLYYHVGVLVRTGIAEAAGWRGAGRERERIYRLAVDEVAGAVRDDSPGDLALAAKALTAMLRLTDRELKAALADPTAPGAVARRQIGAMRGKARLTAREFERLHALVRQVRALLSKAKSRTSGGRLYTVTVVITPSQQARTR